MWRSEVLLRANIIKELIAILMVKTKKIRQVGIWVIAGVTLMTLLGLNVARAYTYVDTVVIVALIVLILWLIAMAIISSLCHRH